MKEAEDILLQKMARNLVTSTCWEDETDYIFEIALKDEDGNIVPLVGDNLVRINKETGEMV